MKRKFGFTLLLTVLFTLLFAASAQAACSHPIYKYVVGKKATCCEAGYKNLVCNKCGWVKKAKAKEISATGKHLRTRVLVTKQPTCTATGVRKTYCATTGKVLKTEKLAPLGHSGKLVTVKKATCCESGYQNRVCTRCNKTIATRVKVLPATGKHSKTRVLVTKQPTCTATGVKKIYCASTNKLIRTEKIKATGHQHTAVRYGYMNSADGKFYDREYCLDCGTTIKLTPTRELTDPIKGEDADDDDDLGNITMTKPTVNYPAENTHGEEDIGDVTFTKPAVNYPAENTHGK